MLVWGIIIFLILGSLLTFGLLYKKKYPYLKEEHILEKAAKDYMKTYKGIKPDENINLTITSKELRKNGNIGEIKHDDKKCSGKVVVEYKRNKYIYNASVKCK